MILSDKSCNYKLRLRVKLECRVSGLPRVSCFFWEKNI